MARRGRVVAGLTLVAIGGLFLTDTLGVLALDTRRLADYWPLVFVLIGLVVLFEAWAPGRRFEAREPATGKAALADADELERRLQERLDRLTARPAEVQPPSAATQATDTTQPRPPAAEPVPRQRDVVAALLELQGLRRNRLISKREYRAKRSELAARMSPVAVSQHWAESAAVGEGGMYNAGVAASRSVPGLPPW